MDFPICNKFVVVAFDQYWCVGVQPKIAITKQIIIEKCYFQRPKDTSVYKDWSML